MTGVQERERERDLLACYVQAVVGVVGRDGLGVWSKVVAFLWLRFVIERVGVVCLVVMFC